jgi:tRNA1(Val) A37 N6-methylase TrmN6
VRSVLCFGKQPETTVEEQLTVRNDDGSYTDAYIELTRDFHNVDLRKAGQ